MADDGRCAECRSSNLAVVSIRDVQRSARRDDPPGVERPVLYRTVEVRCRRCRWSDSLLRRVAPERAADTEPGAAADGGGT